MFVLRLAWRYAFSRSNRHRTASFVIMLGIAIGMTAIITILALMNSLQSELLEQVRSVESFHMQVVMNTPQVDDVDYMDIIPKLQNLDLVESVFPFIDTQVLVQDNSSRKSTTARLRLLPQTIWSQGNAFSDNAYILVGDAQSEGQVLIGYSLAAALSLRLDDELSITLLREGQTATLAPFTLGVGTAGLFRTTLAEFDTSTLLGELSQFSAILGTKNIIYGLYLKELGPRAVERAREQIQELFPNARILTWQQLNNAFYSALLLEKTLMYLFLFFMFVILGVNIRNASARLLFVKRKELAIQRAMGSRRRQTTVVFILQAVVITALGEIVGIFAGLFVSANINKVFSWINTMQFAFTGRNNPLLSYPFVTLVKKEEVFIVAVSVLLLAMSFAYLGCRRLLKEEPMEMLYHE